MLSRMKSVCIQLRGSQPRRRIRDLSDRTGYVCGVSFALIFLYVESDELVIRRRKLFRLEKRISRGRRA